MTECEQCTQTLTRGGHWHGYGAACDGCTARAAARSMAAFVAIRKGEEADLRAMLARLFPRATFEQGMKAVDRWWRLDHQQEQST